MSPSAATSATSIADGGLPRVTLVLGGARSGKSRFAELLVASHDGGHAYVATAEAGDGEMAERIRRHRARRDPAWKTTEEPIDLPRALKTATADGSAALVDCLTLWLSNLMAAGHDVESRTATLIQGLPRLRGPVVFVSNEVGLGIVPDNALARAFRDQAGELHQAIAAAADRVYFVTASLPQLLKDTAHA
jgi:adenosylcobinamide kinase / adenosylcobinamide-phosphate guanylyltransferase